MPYRPLTPPRRIVIDRTRDRGPPPGMEPGISNVLAHKSPHKPPPAATPGALLTPDQAGAALGVTTRVLERWRGCGDGPVFVRLSRKTIRYRVEDIEAFVAANRCASTAPGAGLPATA